MGPHFMLLPSIYVLYSNVSYIYPVSCMSCGNKIVSKLFEIFHLGSQIMLPYVPV